MSAQVHELETAVPAVRRQTASDQATRALTGLAALRTQRGTGPGGSAAYFALAHEVQDCLNRLTGTWPDWAPTVSAVIGETCAVWQVHQEVIRPRLADLGAVRAGSGRDREIDAVIAHLMELRTADALSLAPFTTPPEGRRPLVALAREVRNASVDVTVFDAVEKWLRTVVRVLDLLSRVTEMLTIARDEESAAMSASARRR